jgi:hypothetical protein
VYSIFSFFPTEVAAKGVGVQHLIEELRSFGELEIIASPARFGSASKRSIN